MLCSGGGGRVDWLWGVAEEHFHEFWPSDNTDPLIRVPMAMGLFLFLSRRWPFADT